MKKHSFNFPTLDTLFSGAILGVALLVVVSVAVSPEMLAILA